MYAEIVCVYCYNTEVLQVFSKFDQIWILNTEVL